VEQAKSGGGVFYATPGRPSDADIPAELEVNDTTKLEDIDKDLASLKSLCFEGGKEYWSSSLEHWSRNSKGAPPPADVLLEILPRYTSLQELHLKKTWRGEMSSGYINRMLQVAPHLAQTLKVLSLPNIDIEPEGVESLVAFENLEHLDLWNCLSFAYWEDSGTFDYDYDSFTATETLPYDNGLGACITTLENLTRLDLGFGDDDSKRGLHDYILSRDALWAIGSDLEDRGGKVTFEEYRSPPSSTSFDKVAARKRVLLSLSKNEEEKQEIRQMASEELRSL
jgi:hypothetical protein